MIASNDSAIVLVSSSNSACYWKNTPGHYVTIFLYDKQKDAVFLGDSGDPKHNRRWIALKKIYRSLKTESDYQVMTVTGYQASKDSWKHKKASGSWIRSDGVGQGQDFCQFSPLAGADSVLRGGGPQGRQLYPLSG